ncbi:MAG TPA: ABC transporter ATP-binding protein [Planctomycetota bacterium]|nr:ABC transporter ATP-binding protein [Planctomycetota bacterium]
MSGIQIQKICKRYESGADVREILRDLSLNVFAGKSVAIMGPSGSGKTTLLNILGTLDTPTSGSVDIFGTDPFKLSEPELARFRNINIGFVFQSHHLLPQCSVLENVLLPTVVNGASADAIKGEGALPRAKRLLERVGLSARINDRPARLSGGERQRAAVVRALINGPRLLLADEPTGSLDHASADNIAALLAELKREEKVALVVVTHTLEVAQRMDLLFELRDGTLVPVAKTSPVTTPP